MDIEFLFFKSISRVFDNTIDISSKKKVFLVLKCINSTLIQIIVY